MINQDVQILLNTCREELQGIQALLTGLGPEAKPTPYVKKYAVIRATGAVEWGFKKIIADKVDEDSHQQVKNFIERKIRKSSCNPKMGQIENMILEFDSRWHSKFLELISLANKPTLTSALKNLVDARNSFAHGGDPDFDIDDTVSCFDSAIQVLQILDATVHFEFDEEDQIEDEEIIEINN
ncbi:HEPN domain-containing protein [Vibrio rhizosphaerae]|uniref:HEPN domain-containing protein n=1 Tax=Vibrio rhizosphaerae TaxID=398736 RepID=UPI00056FC63B|nr:HEPN domain-containing protein [Vibrio rhizosphaerae]